MNQTEKHWYQDGFTVIAVVIVATLLFSWLRNESKRNEEASRPVIVPLFSGRVEQPFFGDPVLHMTVWHQFPGTLRNGTLTIDTTSPMIAERDQHQIHSFETWQPNRDQEVTFRLTLQNFDPDTELPIDVKIVAANGRSQPRTETWLGQGWKPASRR